MSQFLSNLPPPLRSRFSSGPSAASDEQSLVSSSSLVVVPTSVAIVTPPSDGVGPLAPAPCHGHSANEDVVPPVEPLEPARRMDKGKQPTEEGFQHKRKQNVSVERDSSIPREGLMADAKCTGREVEFFIIDSGADPMGRLADVSNCCKQHPLHLRLPIQWLNECLSKKVGRN